MRADWGPVPIFWPTLTDGSGNANHHVIWFRPISRLASWQLADVASFSLRFISFSAPSNGFWRPQPPRRRCCGMRMSGASLARRRIGQCDRRSCSAAGGCGAVVGCWQCWRRWLFRSSWQLHRVPFFGWLGGARPFCVEEATIAIAMAAPRKSDG